MPRNLLKIISRILILFRMGFFGRLIDRGRGKKNPSPKNLSHISYNDETSHSYTLPKEDPKTIRITWHTPGVLLTSAFLLEIIKFCSIKKYRYTFHLDTWFLILLTFLESLRIVLTNMVPILMMSAKLAIPGSLKIIFFWKKGFDVIISVHDATNKILSLDWNYNVNLVMWPKFGNSSISVREVIITSIL